jgi:predicted DNA-binding protein
LFVIPLGKQRVNIMKAKEEIRFNVRASKKQKNELRRIANATGIPQSVIIREAIEEKIANINGLLAQGEKIFLGVVSR